MHIKENQLHVMEYRTLRESVGWNNFTNEQVSQALEKNAYSIVLYDEGIAVGMGRLLGDGMYYTIVDVIVHPAYQRKGFGRYMLQQIIAYVDKHTVKGWKSSIQLIAAQGKEPFYESLGFHKLPNQDTGCGMQIILMK